MPKGYSKRNQSGWKHKNSSISKMKKNRRPYNNENNPRWRGNKVSYQALHNWIRNHFIRPRFCEFCNINPGFNSRGYNNLHWANKSGKYLSNRNDWICLCGKCHRKLDKPWIKKKINSGIYSKIVGVTFDKSRNKWIASLNRNNKNIFRKRFNTEKEAIKYLNKIKKQYDNSVGHG
jgi:hypothetical protein